MRQLCTNALYELDGILHHLVRLGEWLRKHTVELRAGPLDAVLDLGREVAQSAHRDALLLVLRAVHVRDRLVRQNDLDVALRAQRAALEQRLLEPHTATVHVVTGLDVVQRVRHEVQLGEERLAEQLLCALVHHLSIHHSVVQNSVHSQLEWGSRWMPKLSTLDPRAQP